MVFVVFSENEKEFCVTELATEDFNDAILELKKGCSNRFLEVCKGEDVVATIIFDSDSNEYVLELEEEDIIYNSIDDLQTKVKNLFK